MVYCEAHDVARAAMLKQAAGLALKSTRSRSRRASPGSPRRGPEGPYPSDAEG